jgi:hypothetical protein
MAATASAPNILVQTKTESDTMPDLVRYYLVNIFERSPEINFDK